jgi:hypothetical protein
MLSYSQYLAGSADKTAKVVFYTYLAIPETAGKAGHAQLGIRLLQEAWVLCSKQYIHAEVAVVVPTSGVLACTTRVYLSCAVCMYQMYG